MIAIFGAHEVRVSSGAEKSWEGPLDSFFRPKKVFLSIIVNPRLP